MKAKLTVFYNSLSRAYTRNDHSFSSSMVQFYEYVQGYVHKGSNFQIRVDDEIHLENVVEMMSRDRTKEGIKLTPQGYRKHVPCVTWHCGWYKYSCT